MIHCQNCRTQNSSDASTCQQCGANLLPPESKVSRGIKLVIFCLFGIGFVALFIIGFLAEESKVLVYTSLIIGLLLIARGIWEMIHVTPLYQRYQIRAKRHIRLDPQQAVNDLSIAIDKAPRKLAFSLKNLGFAIGYAIVTAYNALRGRRLKYKLRDIKPSKTKIRLINKRLKLLMKLDERQAIREMVKEIRLTHQLGRDCLGEAMPKRLMSLGMKLTEQISKDKIAGNEKDFPIHWISYSYVLEANIEKLSGKRVAMGWHEGLEEGARKSRMEQSIRSQLGVERIGMWRKKELKAITYCFSCHTPVETEFKFDANPKGDCSESVLEQIAKCPSAAEHELSWPIFVTPEEADDMKKALQRRMAVLQS